MFSWVVLVFEFLSSFFWMFNIYVPEGGEIDPD